MLRPVHAATNGIRTSSPLARVGKLVASGVPAATQYVLGNNHVSFTFETDPVTGVHLKSWKHTNGNTQNNHSTSLWALYINRAERFGNLRIVYPHDRYYRTVRDYPLPIPGGRKFVFEWVGVPVEKDVRITIQVTATLMNSSSHVELSARILATDAGAFLELENCVAGFQFLNLALDGSTTDAGSDVWSVPTQQGSSVLNPVSNLQVPRHDKDSRIATVGATKLFFGDPSFHAISPATDIYRATAAHPGVLSMPFVSFSNRISKDGTLIYASDPEGISAKAFYWWADGRYVHLRIHDQSDTEFHPHGVGRWNDGVALEDHTYEWTMRIRPYVSPTRWSDEYAAVLYEREGLDSLTYLPDPLWQRALDGDIDTTVADTPFAVVGFGIGGVTGEQQTRHLLSGAVAWQDVYTGAVTGSAKPSLYMPVHTASFDLDGANMFWYGTGSSAESYSPDNSRLRDDYTGVADEILKSGLLPAMPYNLFRPPISTLSEWTTGIVAYDLIAKFYEGVDDPLFNIASNGNVGRTYETELKEVGGGVTDIVYQTSDMYTDEFGNDGSAMCLFPDPCQDVLSENMTGLAAAGVLSYRDTMGSWQFGCYAESHQYGGRALEPGEPGPIVSPAHPRSVYARYWNSLQTGIVGTWNSGIADMMSPSWGGTTTNNLGSISATEYLGDSQLKYALGSIESRRWTDRTVYTTNSGDPDVRRGSYPIYNIAPPVWLEAKPLFNMVHGARSRQYSILGHFGNATTATGAYYPEGDVLGFVDGAVAHHRQDISKRHQDGRLNMTVKCLSLGTMFSVHNWSDHLTGNASADFTAMEKDMQVFLTGDQYTGEVAYCKTWMQTVASAKQYHLDGNMMYGLDRWESPLGYATQDEATIVKVSAKYHSGVSGEQKILHNVRKHRSTSDAYLLTAFNWASGAETYTGVFDPVAYEMYGGYTVYRVDHTDVYGQRIWVSDVSPRQTYELTETLPGKAASLWEFTSELSIRGGISTLPCDLKVGTINVRYSYGKKPLYTATLGVGYSYGSECYTSIDPPHVGYKAPATQSIVNNLPQWMETRGSETSNGWQLTNSYGMALESLTDLVTKDMKNLFLATADRNLRSRYYKGELTVDEIFLFDSSRNLLSNSSFSRPDTARTRLPYEWTDYHKPASQTVFLDKTRKLKGTYAVRIDGRGVISQLTDISNLGALDTITASVYFYTDATAVDVSLVLAVQDINGVNTLGETKYEGTAVGWNRLVVSVTVSEDSFLSQVTLRSNSSSSVWFDCAQLEDSSRASDWQASDVDKLSYVDPSIPLRLVEAYSNTDRVTIFPIGNVPEFTEVPIPTRIEFAQPAAIDFEPFSSATHGRRVDFFNDVKIIDWIISSGKIAAVSSTSGFDILETYDIRDLRLYQNLGYGTIADCLVTVTPLATAMRDNLLFVACKEVYRGRTLRTLKVVYPRRPPAGETYLESLVDFELDLKFDTTFGDNIKPEEIFSIGFSERDPNWLIVNTNLGRRLYFRMYYDYYFANLRTRAIYTLEQYDTAQLQVT